MSDDWFSDAKICFVSYLTPKIFGVTGFVSQWMVKKNDKAWNAKL